MSSAIQIALVVLVPTALFVVFLRIPHWGAQSLNRHRLWRLRDRIVDDMIDGRLPKDDPAVRDLLRKVEFVIRNTPTITALMVYVWKSLPESHKARGKAEVHRLERSKDALSSEECERLKRYEARLRSLLASTTLLGSWLGLATILRFVIPALRMVHRERAQIGRSRLPALEDEVKVTLRTATDNATRDAWIGRRAHDFIARDLDRRTTPTGVA